MRTAILWILLFYCALLFAQVKVCSWNLCDMGKSKSPLEIRQLARLLKGFDLVALQEIVPGPDGITAVAKLSEELNRLDGKWMYCVSVPTVGSRQKRERYAFLWKPSKVTQVGRAWLDSFYSLEIEREPYLCTFRYGSKEFTVVNFHAITKRLQPETEIKYFKNYPSNYPRLNLVFAGDFNCPQTHSVFGPLKRAGFAAALTNVKTTLKRKCASECTASEFDNFFYDKRRASVTSGGALAFYSGYTTLDDARKLSDHLPIWIVLVLK